MWEIIKMYETVLNRVYMIESDKYLGLDKLNHVFHTE